MNKYILSFVLLISNYSYILSMHESCDNALVVTGFDDDKPFTLQAIRIYNLPCEFLRALEHPHMPENYAGNLKDIRTICTWFHETTTNEKRAKEAQRMYYFENRQLSSVNSVGDREDWTPDKIERVRATVHAAAHELLNRKLKGGHDASETMALLKKKY